jgi:hypothetical protein
VLEPVLLAIEVASSSMRNSEAINCRRDFCLSKYPILQVSLVGIAFWGFPVWTTLWPSLPALRAPRLPGRGLTLFREGSYRELVLGGNRLAHGARASAVAHWVTRT